MSRVSFTRFVGQIHQGARIRGWGGGQPNSGNASILGAYGPPTHPLPMSKLGEIDEVSANHVGKVSDSWRKDGVDSKTPDFFLKVVSGFNLEPGEFHIHHFVLNTN